MPDVLRGFITVLVAILLGIVVVIVVDLTTGELVDPLVALVIGAIFGLLYGLEAGILLSYKLDSGVGWLQLIVDFTWSLPNTIFGFVFGNIIYIFFGTPSRNYSKDRAWIAFAPRSSTGFGNNVLQTLGTVNLGGAGQHELMHVLQARIFGPLYLPIFAINYAFNFIVQLLFTGTVGLVLWLLKARAKPYFRPPSHSAVGGFFGWIYYANLFELWAYSAGNP